MPYTLNPRLVRGLDYYTRTTFEFTVPSSADPASGLGTQNALLGGGRYDGLSEMLGGPKPPASASPSARTASSSPSRPRPQSTPSNLEP